MDKQEKANMYIGRFMNDFSGVECMLNIVFEELFNLNNTTSFILLPNLDIGRKLRLTEIALGKEKYNEHKNEFIYLRKLATIRNVIAHTVFHGEDGDIYLDYVNPKGEMKLPHNIRTEDDELESTSITYEEFDEFHEQAQKLMMSISDIAETCEPVGDLTSSPEHRSIRESIAEIMGSSDNIIRFPRRTREDE